MSQSYDRTTVQVRLAIIIRTGTACGVVAAIQLFRTSILIITSLLRTFLAQFHELAVNCPEKLTVLPETTDI